MTNIDTYVELVQDAEIAQDSGRLESAEKYRNMAQHVYKKMSNQEKFIVDSILNHLKDAEIISTNEI